MFGLGINNVSATDDAEFELGALGTTDDGNVWYYTQASSAIDQYDAVQIATTKKASSTAVAGLRGQQVAVAAHSAAADKYLWVQVYGTCTVNAKASCAANAELYNHASTGHVEDASTTNADKIVGMVLTTARAATDGTAPALLNWPMYSD